ncbi:hypothetical protein [Bradyrhizobium sp. CCGUVB23]|uniref:hypothetical protein n=1 Tax=Bradyrhizobium sp. CCGUVB23 TaxID=2949630 RepID=UPI0020B2F0ED|nr:hypothetical protein [Bradyrhizobium sp. CCGUVB23]MCP3468334.1 hypothetical protein [Bradyrhizobium sp. CCGUVB23]
MLHSDVVMKRMTFALKTTCLPMSPVGTEPTKSGTSSIHGHRIASSSKSGGWRDLLVFAGLFKRSGSTVAKGASWWMPEARRSFGGSPSKTGARDAGETDDDTSGPAGRLDESAVCA